MNIKSRFIRFSINWLFTLIILYFITFVIVLMNYRTFTLLEFMIIPFFIHLATLPFYLCIEGVKT